MRRQSELPHSYQLIPGSTDPFKCSGRNICFMSTSTAYLHCLLSAVPVREGRRILLLVPSKVSGAEGHISQMSLLQHTLSEQPCCSRAGLSHLQRKVRDFQGHKVVVGVGDHQINPHVGTLVVSAGNECCMCHHPQQTVHTANIHNSPKPTHQNISM